MPLVLRRSLLYTLSKFKRTNFNVRRFEEINRNISRPFSCSDLLAATPSTLQASYDLIPPKDVIKPSDSKQEILFQEPRALFNRVINEAYFTLEINGSVQPRITTEEISQDNSGTKLWVTKIVLDWPEPFCVEGVAGRKSDSEKLAYTYACEKLKEYGCIDDHNNVITSDEQLQFEGQVLKNPKADLGNIFQVIWTTVGNQNLIPRYENVHIPGAAANTFVWKSTLKLEYPEEKTFHGISSRASTAEKIAASKALQWLFEKGVIDRKRKPLLFSRESVKKLQNRQNKPYPLYIPPENYQEMQNVIDSYKSFKEVYKDCLPKILESVSSTEAEHVIQEEEQQEECVLHESNDSFKEFCSIFTEKPYSELTPSAAELRNLDLINHQNSFLVKFQNIMTMRKKLPIYKHREEILNLIDNNQVVVISGETGSGKSTQVPQFILEKFISENRGSDCNIVVTQPRRISAISVSQYVANERGEEVGSTVGYQVRLNRKLPQGHGAIFFCTTGILLRKLCFNEKLKGVSHVIIDEVHERTVQIDFLLILMKKLLEENKDLKLILMSATFNTFLFSKYFNNCPVLHVSGNMYPVTEYFLDDIPNVAQNIQSNHMNVNFDLVSRVIAHVDETQPPGAILCFLPGWHEIRSVLTKLKEMYGDEKSEKIIFRLLHSRLLPEEQAKVFDKTEPGVRKIILATNVAETSITVEDVVYVIDSGFHKGTTFDEETGITSLGMKWITKANVRQRRGRAGRVQPGVCYHLYPRKVFAYMQDYPVPEILRLPLEKVVLESKIHCPSVKVQDFLSLALQPPPASSIHFGIQELEDLGILDSEENMTRLGHVVKYFATHPRLSKAIVLASYLRCLDPVLTISAFLTITQDPFSGMLENKKDIQEIKKKYDLGRCSDHLAFCELFNRWDNIEDADEKKAFEEANMLDSNSFLFIKQLKGLFVENLYDSEVISSPTFLDNYSSNSHSSPFVCASLAGAFYPNVIKLLQGTVSNGKLDPEAIVYSLLRNQKALIQDESVASKQYELPSPWLVYYSGMQSEARQKIMASAVTSAAALHFIFFAGRELSLKLNEKGKDPEEAILTLDNSTKLSFSMSQAEANLLMEWRQMIQELFQVYVAMPKKRFSYSSVNLIEFFDSSALPVLTRIFDAYQVPFSPGVTYELRNGKIQSSLL